VYTKAVTITEKKIPDTATGICVVLMDVKASAQAAHHSNIASIMKLN